MKEDINILEREKITETGVKENKRVKNLDDKYGMKKKGLVKVVEEVKHKILAKAVKIKRYGDRITQYRQNQMCEVEQQKCLKCVILDAKENKNFSWKIWSNFFFYVRFFDFIHMHNTYNLGHNILRLFDVLRNFLNRDY